MELDFCDVCVAVEHPTPRDLSNSLIKRIERPGQGRGPGYAPIQSISLLAVMQEDIWNWVSVTTLFSTTPTNPSLVQKTSHGGEVGA